MWKFSTYVCTYVHTYAERIAFLEHYICTFVERIAFLEHYICTYAERIAFLKHYICTCVETIAFFKSEISNTHVHMYALVPKNVHLCTGIKSGRKDFSFFIQLILSTLEKTNKTLNPWFF
jgi:hypothetical protein